MPRDEASRATDLVVVLGCALTYTVFFFFNHLLFDRLEYTSGVNWVFLPSGLRLALVLVFLTAGSIGITLASIAITWFFYGQGALDAFVTGCISGFAPWLARRVSIDWLRIDPDIQHLDARQLLQLSLIFSVTSSVMHQLWFTFEGLEQDFIKNTLVMIVGDLLGTLLMLFAVRLFIMWLRASRVNT